MGWNVALSFYVSPVHEILPRRMAITSKTRGETDMNMPEPQIILYPHYCHACLYSFVSEERNAICPKCGKGGSVLNCFGEITSEVNKEKHESE